MGVVGELATGDGVVQMHAFAGMELATGSAKESPFLAARAMKRGASGKEGGAGGFPIDGHAAKAGTQPAPKFRFRPCAGITGPSDAGNAFLGRLIGLYGVR